MFSGEDMDEARRQGMTDVGMVLAKRIADMRRQEAAELDKEAGEKVEAIPAVATETPVPPSAKSADTWALMSENSIAHVTSSEVIGRKLTEIFNFDARERVQISENLKTGVETLGQPEKFDTLSPAVIQRAQDMLKALNGDNAKRSFKL